MVTDAIVLAGRPVVKGTTGKAPQKTNARKVTTPA
jgi:hypothetical protein